MRIQLRDEKRVFQGTATEVVQQMQVTAIFAAHLSLPDYIDWCVGNAKRLLELDVKVTGDSVEERCASLIAELVRTGFADEL